MAPETQLLKRERVSVSPSELKSAELGRLKLNTSDKGKNGVGEKKKRKKKEIVLI